MKETTGGFLEKARSGYFGNIEITNGEVVDGNIEALEAFIRDKEVEAITTDRKELAENVEETLYRYNSEEDYKNGIKAENIWNDAITQVLALIKPQL